MPTLPIACVRRQRSSAARPRHEVRRHRRAIEGHDPTCKRTGDGFDDPLHVEEVHRPASAAPVRGSPLPVSADRDAPRLAGARHARAELEQAARRRARDGGCARPTSISPGSSDGRSTENCADSGLRDGHDRAAASAKCAASAASMNENVSASEQPAASSTRRTSRSRSIARVGRRWRGASAPERSTAIGRSRSGGRPPRSDRLRAATSTRNVGDRHVPSGVIPANLKTQSLEDALDVGIAECPGRASR